jgi:DNA-binding Lrp family transcriptional regulator
LDRPPAPRAPGWARIGFPGGLGTLRSTAMDPLLKLLRENAALKTSQLAALLGIPEEEVTARIKAYEDDRVILGYRTVLNEEKLGRDIVRAVIEVRITPERGGGFDRLADRIAKYAEVESCYLMSGGYDLLVIVVGNNLREVAAFVSEKLSTIQGVLSTATHFLLKPYKGWSWPRALRTRDCPLRRDMAIRLPPGASGSLTRLEAVP